MGALLCATLVASILPFGGAWGGTPPLLQLAVGGLLALAATLPPDRLTAAGALKGWLAGCGAFALAVALGLLPVPMMVISLIAPGSASDAGWTFASTAPEATSLALGRWLAVAGFGAAVIAWSGSRHRRHEVERAGVALAGFFAVFATLHLAAGTRSLLGMVPTSLVAGRPFFAPFVDPNHFGAFGLALLPLVAGEALDHLRGRGGASAMWRAGVTVLLAVLVLATASAGVALALGVMLAVWAIRRWRWPAAGALAVGAVMVLGSSPTWWWMLEPRLEGSLWPRVRMWGDALAILPRWWLLGVGAGGFGAQIERFRTDCVDRVWVHAHHVPYEWVLETGLIGLILGVVGLYLAWPAAARDGQGDERARRLDLGLIGLLVHNAYDFSLLLPGVALLAAALWTARSALFGLPRSISPALARAALLGLAALQVPFALWAARGALADRASAAVDAAAAGSPGEVVDAARPLVWAAPWRPEADVAAGWAALEAGDVAGALALAEAAARDHATDGETLRRLGLLRARAGDCPGALDTLDRAATQLPASWRTHAAIGRVARVCRDDARVLAGFGRALECQAPNAILDQAFAALPIGIVWVDELADAPAAYSARLANLAAKAGDPATAAVAWDQAALIAPATFGTRLERAEYLHRAGRNEEAWIQTERFLSLHAENPRAQALRQKLVRLGVGSGAAQDVASTSPLVRQIREAEAAGGPAAGLRELERLALLGSAEDPSLKLERARLSLAAGDAAGCLATLLSSSLGTDPILGTQAKELEARCRSAAP